MSEFSYYVFPAISGEEYDQHSCRIRKMTLPATIPKLMNILPIDGDKGILGKIQDQLASIFSRGV